VPHFVVPPEHVIVHAPLEHVPDPVPELGPGHTLPQLPQLAASVDSLTHAPLHAESPAPQQTPFVHALPLPHTVPQAPQLLLSVLVFTHLVPHFVGVPPEQVIAHAPLEQLAEPVPEVGPAHAVPQLPQLLVFVLRSTHVFEQLV
jgi:hypothetical protein